MTGSNANMNSYPKQTIVEEAYQEKKGLEPWEEMSFYRKGVGASHMLCSRLDEWFDSLDASSARRRGQHRRSATEERR